MIETPTEFLLGKASRVIEEILKGLGAEHVSISTGSSGVLHLYVTHPMLSKDLSDINFVKDAVISYFGLDKSQLTFEVESRYRVQLTIKNESQKFEIEVKNPL